MKTAELTGVALDWAVAKCEGLTYVNSTYYFPNKIDCFLYYSPSKDWSLSGPIIEREQLSVEFDSYNNSWYAQKFCVNPVTGSCVIYVSASGSTLLIAAMRCYVASKLGDEVEIPSSLE